MTDLDATVDGIDNPHVRAILTALHASDPENSPGEVAVVQAAVGYFEQRLVQVGWYAGLRLEDDIAAADVTWAFTEIHDHTAGDVVHHSTHDGDVPMPVLPVYVLAELREDG